jgi:hypothetical protein
MRPSGIAAARGGWLAASEMKGLQPGCHFFGDLLEIPCSRRIAAGLSAISEDVPAMKAGCSLWVNRDWSMRRPRSRHVRFASNRD